MPPETIPVPAASTLDFSTRVDPPDLPEWMDEAASYEDFRDCLRDLDRVNRWTLGFRPAERFLKRIASRQYPQRLRVLDVGFGSGTGLRRLGAAARKHNLPVRLTGIDLNPMAARAAAEFAAAAPHVAAPPATPAGCGKSAASLSESAAGPITWLTGNALVSPEVQGQDVILSTLVTHHMRDTEIVDFLRWMETTASVGWFINDLLRSSRAYRLFTWLARLMRWHPFVQHDGPVSIRRGFRSEDWQRLLALAGIPASAVRIEQLALGRLCLTRLH